MPRPWPSTTRGRAWTSSSPRPTRRVSTRGRSGCSPARRTRRTWSRAPSTARSSPARELAARDGLERARVARANAESTAKAARADAEARQRAATAAKQASDAALAAADAAAQEQVRALAELDAQRSGVQAQLDAAEARDAGLHAQRDRFRAWQRQMAAEQAAREEAARRDAADRLALLDRPAAPGIHLPAFPRPARGGAVQRVIDRALSQVGVQYVWGGGSGRGPTRGIPDGLGSPLSRIGFDCSGLMLYAYSGAGVALPRVSRNQFNAGRKVPVSDLRPGDLVFYKRPGAPIHHVAMYIGGGTWWRRPTPARRCASCRCAGPV